MVLGLKSKNRKGISVQVDYLIHVHEIKPWPPSQSSRSAQAVLLQWENGDQSSGSFNSGVGDGKIEFSHSFRLPVTLHREASKKSATRDSFQKNCLEFYFYESLRDKAVRGQQLGSAIINLAAYGIVQESITISTPINCKKGSRSTVQAVLYVSIQPFDKYSSSSSPNESLSKEVSLETDGSGSVLKLMNEDNEEEEIASFTDDDDASSHSSRTTSAFETTGGSHRNGKNQLESEKDSTGRLKGEISLPLEVAPVKSQVKTEDKAIKQLNGSLSSTVHISDLGSHVLNPVSKSEFPHKSLTSILEKSVIHSVQSSSSYLGSQDRRRESDNYKTSFQQRTMAHDYHEKASTGSGRSQENAQQSSRNNITGFASLYMNVQAGVNSNLASATVSQANQEDERNAGRLNKNDQDEARASNLNDGLLKDRKKKEQPENGQEDKILETENLSPEEVAFISSQDAARQQVRLRSDAQTFSRKELGVQGSIVRNDRLKHLKSVQLHFDSTKQNELFSNTQFTRKVKDINIPKDADIDPMNYARSETKETKGFSDSKVELESKIEMLEEELKEAAAIEVGLYSVVAEHGSSVNKVHAPARRLSRLYFHACKTKSPAKRASAGRTAISGLVLVSKACGNDVPRLTFWLSNSIVFRAIVCQAVGKFQLSNGPCINSKDGGKGSDKKSSLKCHETSSNDVGISNKAECFDDWEDPQTFIMTLEKVEGWIFSRIVESVWWQTLTPHMQSAAAKGSNSRKTYGRRSSLGDQEQGNFSIDLWKKAFKDACERLCPIRAGGHECGCLPVLSRLVMEQLVCRLDVAMFNAILRESDEEMPTDPVSDPISDPKVLPIPAGKSSFGAGAQLKNAIGNWSRWLTDLFGIDDNDSLGDNNELGHEKRLESETSFKTFHHLNALSDLMMLPFEMLADRSTRKEVCPTLDAVLIKRVLNNFVPDEFCPNPIPEIVFEALDSEDLIETKEDSITSCPCIATPTVYSPPPAASLMSIIGEVGSQTPARSGSSVLRKSYTSDDELDEVDSPITSIFGSSTTPKSAPKGKGGRKIVRYQLLRQVWKNSE